MKNRFSVAILTQPPDWHAKKLNQAFLQFGFASCIVTFPHCRIATSSEETAFVQIPGYPKKLPDAVVVRAALGTTKEQFIFRIGLLKALEHAGVMIVNTPEALENATNKALASVLLSRAGVATVATWATEEHRMAAEIVSAETSLRCKVVLKPLTGSQGRGLHLLSDASQFRRFSISNKVFYLQRFAAISSSSGSDYRAFVVGNRVVAAMARHSNGWIHNAARGARCEPIRADSEIGALALAASRATRTDFSGVDIIRAADGRLAVLEVNALPAWVSVQSVSRVDIAYTLASWIHCRLAGGAMHT